jgi:putative membrane protein
MDILTMKPVLASIIFSLLGIVILLIGYFIIEKLTPENTWEQISKNNNMALAIVFAAFIIGMSMIISAAIHG